MAYCNVIAKVMVVAGLTITTRQFVTAPRWQIPKPYSQSEHRFPHKDIIGTGIIGVEIGQR
jgi:hypothetical protein